MLRYADWHLLYYNHVYGNVVLRIGCGFTKISVVHVFSMLKIAML